MLTIRLHLALRLTWMELCVYSPYTPSWRWRTQHSFLTFINHQDISKPPSYNAVHDRLLWHNNWNVDKYGGLGRGGDEFDNTRCLMTKCLFVLWKEVVVVVHFKRSCTVPEVACRKWDKPRQLDCSPRNEVRIFLVWSRMVGTAEWHLVCRSHHGIFTRLN